MLIGQYSASAALCYDMKCFFYLLVKKQVVAHFFSLNSY